MTTQFDDIPRMVDTNCGPPLSRASAHWPTASLHGLPCRLPGAWHHTMMATRETHAALQMTLGVAAVRCWMMDQRSSKKKRMLIAPAEMNPTQAEALLRPASFFNEA